MKRLEQRDGGTTVLMDGERWRTTYIDGCEFCDDMKAKMEWFYPRHKASPRCESGGHAHCTCDRCF